MITCPLCHELVHLKTYEPIILDGDGNRINEPKPVHLRDYEVDDFFCPTKVLTSEGDFISWSHYERMTLQGCLPKYVTIIPPFYFSWQTDGRLNVRRMYYKNSEIRLIRETIFEDNNIKLEDLPKIYERFKTLKAFS